MPDDNENQRQWVVEPPGPGQISVQMAFGDGVELNEEQAAALGELLRSLEARDPEVTGHALAKPCSDLSSCKTLKCTGLGSCNHLGCGTLKAATASASTTWNLMGTFPTGAQ